MHYPVLLNEVIQNLKLAPGQLVVDATFGGGGHARAILEQLGSTGELIGFDRDPAAIARGREQFSNCPNLRLINRDFREMISELKKLGVEKIDGALFDLGVSSFQIDDPTRGFSWNQEAPLDMRMDPAQQVTAAQIINTYSADELSRIFYEYGEERFSRKIAARVVQARTNSKIETSTELKKIITAAAGGSYHARLSSIARIFQALRIEVNQELSGLTEILEVAAEILQPGGRLAVISFHSLEDRIVKVLFKKLSMQGKINIITKKPVTAGEAELAANSRSRSAKLRVAEKSLSPTPLREVAGRG